MGIPAVYFINHEKLCNQNDLLEILMIISMINASGEEIGPPTYVLLVVKRYPESF
ncbi:hypothetical protein D3C81_1359950 [compost metagenome]